MTFLEDLTQRIHFNGITQGRARAVRLNVVHVLCLQTGIAERFTNDDLLRRPVGHSESAAGSVLIHGAAPDDCQHSIVICHRIFQALEYKHSGSFTADKPIG